MGQSAKEIALYRVLEDHRLRPRVELGPKGYECTIHVGSIGSGSLTEIGNTAREAMTRAVAKYQGLREDELRDAKHRLHYLLEEVRKVNGADG